MTNRLRRNANTKGVSFCDVHLAVSTSRSSSEQPARCGEAGLPSGLETRSAGAAAQPASQAGPSCAIDALRARRLMKLRRSIADGTYPTAAAVDGAVSGIQAELRRERVGIETQRRRDGETKKSGGGDVLRVRGGLVQREVREVVFSAWLFVLMIVVLVVSGVVLSILDACRGAA